MNIDYRYQLRVTTEWLDKVKEWSAEAGMTGPAFVRKCVEIAGPELVRRIKGETLSNPMEDK